VIAMLARAALCFGALLALPAAAQQPTVEAFGMGISSCATWLSDLNSKRSGDNWALGMWTGLNVAGNLRVGLSTDARGVLGEIEVRCRRQPSKPLATATHQAWIDMLTAGQ